MNQPKLLLHLKVEEEIKDGKMILQGTHFGGFPLCILLLLLDHLWCFEWPASKERSTAQCSRNPSPAIVEFAVFFLWLRLLNRIPQITVFNYCIFISRICICYHCTCICVHYCICHLPPGFLLPTSFKFASLLSSIWWIAPATWKKIIFYQSLWQKARCKNIWYRCLASIWFAFCIWPLSNILGYFLVLLYLVGK